ncbi:hypothetical protein ACT6NV_00730 [Robiginitalea sp. IMCC44478]|uniref:hypothetical protein n=1 Tax=Robiginitalea sp. IMCC44478 TaxID=3459122 RepID=UPI0040416CB8
MGYSMEFKVNPQHLEVVIQIQIEKGKELKEAVARWTKISELCKEHQLDKILAIMEFDGFYGAETKFNLVKKASGFGWDPGYRLAVVVQNDQQYAEMLFTQTAMDNMGYQMKLFKNPRKGRKWLLG